VREEIEFFAIPMEAVEMNETVIVGGRDSEVLLVLVDVDVAGVMGR
jgi:hypothetical protein